MSNNAMNVNTTNKKFLEVLKNAYLNGNRKTLGAAPIEASLGVSFDVYKNTLLMLQGSLHDYVLSLANASDTKGQTAAKTKLFDLLKALVDRVGGVCDATDILYLELSAYKVAKGKDTENKDGSITSGTKALVAVSSTVFRGLVESLLGNKIMGRTWDSAMGSFRELNAAEREKIEQRIAKREAKVQGKVTPSTPKTAAKETPVAKAAPKGKDLKVSDPKVAQKVEMKAVPKVESKPEVKVA